MQDLIPMMKDEVEIIHNTSVYNCYDILLDEEIKEPQYYRRAFQLLREAQEEDVVRIFISSSGGNMTSAVQFKNYIEGCNAHVIAIVDGEAYSAASLIALCAHEIVVKPYSTWMCHSASFGTGGSVGNVKDHVDFISKHADSFMEEVYAGFLSESEIADLRRGVELWLDHEQVGERIERMFKHRQEQYQQQCETEEGGSEPSMSLQDMIEQSVEKVLNKHPTLKPVPVMDDLESHGWNGEA